MPIQETYKDGTITVTADSAVVTGVGTAWLVRLVDGGELSFKGFSIPIASVEANASLTLDYPAPGGMAGSGAYSIALGKADAASTLVATRLLADLTNLLRAGVSPFFSTLLTRADAASVLDGLGFSAFVVSMLDDDDASTVLSTLGISTFVKTMLDDGSASTVLSTLGVTPFAQTLLAVTSGAEVQTTIGISAFAQTILDDASGADVLTTLGVTAFGKTILDDADASAALSTLGVSAFAKSLLDDADAPSARGTLGVTALLDGKLGTDDKAVDSSLLNGRTNATAATPSTIAERDADGNIAVSFVGLGHDATARAADTVFYSSTDDLVRKNTAAGFRTSLSVYSKAEVDVVAGQGMRSFGVGEALPTTNIGPIFHAGYNSIMTWQVFNANGAAYTGYASVGIGQWVFENRATPRAGLAKANGATLSKTTYPALWNSALHFGQTIALGSWTAGPMLFADAGSGNFRLPDLRAQSPRATDDGRGVDSGRTLGSAQGDAIRNITGQVGTFYRASGLSPFGALGVAPYSNTPAVAGNVGGSLGDNPSITFDASLQVPTASENRVKNTSQLACIQF